MTGTKDEATTGPARYRGLRTASLFITFSALGIQGVLGPTMPAIEILFHTDTKTVGLTFIAHTLGYLGGAAFSGVVIDRINQQLLFALAMAVSSIAIGAATFMGGVLPFILSFGVTSFANAICDAGGQPYILGLWQGSRYQGALTQLSHFGWALGAVLSPVIVEPFLGRQEYAYDITEGSDSSIPEINRNITTEASSSTNVQFSYLLVAAYIMAAAAFSAFIYLLGGPLPFAKQAQEPKSKISNVAFIVYVSIILSAYAGLEVTYGNFITSFAVKALGWGHKKGALISAAYWAGFSAGRFLSIPLSLFLSHKTLLNVCITLVNVALFCTLFAARMSEAVVWACAAVSGVAIGPMFATCILWASLSITIDGRVSSVLAVGKALGALVAPTVTAYLFQTVSTACFVYSCLLLSGALLVLFTLGQTVANLFAFCVEDAEKRSRCQTVNAQQLQTMLHTSETPETMVI